jgi:hypothetical protein
MFGRGRQQPASLSHRSQWDLQQQLTLAALLVTTGTAIAAMVVGCSTAENLQTQLLHANQTALVNQGQDIALAYLARMESESHGLERMITRDVLVPSYVHLADLDPSTSDDGALVTAGASAPTLDSLQDFYGQLSNLYGSPPQRDSRLTRFQQGSICKAAGFGRSAVAQLLRIISASPPPDYSAALLTSCARTH